MQLRPTGVAVSKVAPALMAGNTVVIKPPTQVFTAYMQVAAQMPARKSYCNPEAFTFCLCQELAPDSGSAANA